MPIQRTTKDGKPAYKYGKEGKPYTYEPNNEESRKRAYNKAKKQGQVIEISKHKGK